MALMLVLDTILIGLGMVIMSKARRRIVLKLSLSLEGIQ